MCIYETASHYIKLKPTLSEIIMPAIDRDIERNDEELEDEEEVGDEENADEDESQVEPNDDQEEEDEPAPPRPKTRRKREKNSLKTCLWIGFFLFIGLILAGGIGAILYFFVFKTADCFPIQSYEFLKDVKMTTTDQQHSFFKGLVTHSRMLSICDRIDKEISLTSKELEDEFNTNFKTVMNDTFKDLPDEKRLMWTGCYYTYAGEPTSKWEEKCSIDYTKHNNFCNKTTWKTELATLEAETNMKEAIFVVKDFGKPDGCWQLYNTTKLTSIMGQPEGTTPRLSFACTSKQGASGNDAMPGSFKPASTRLGTSDFFIYKISTVFEDAFMECEKQKQQLVTIDNPEKLTTVENAIQDEVMSDPAARFWTGGFLDVSDENNKKDIKWQGSTTTITQFSKDTFRAFTDASLGTAIEMLKKSIKSIKKKQVKECASRDYLYVGLHHPKAGKGNEAKQGLTILNDKGSLKLDTDKFFVLCEKKSG